MIEEIDNPLESYQRQFREEFLEAAKEEFQRLLDASGVDEEENARHVREIRRLEEALSKATNKKGCLSFIIFLLVLGAIAGGVAVYTGSQSHDSQPIVFGILGAILSLVVLFVWVVPARKRAKTLEEQLTKDLEAEKAAAWAQMAPLNSRYDWDITARLIRKVCPILNFDPYFTQGRLAELENHFGWGRDYNTDERSVLFSQSGDIQGNPFAFGEVLAQDWGTKTYTGSLTISWRETETDSDGHTHVVTRTEVLVASVDAPIPTYAIEKFLLYGNDAAPDLSFSRQPSSLSNAGDGWFDRMRKNRELKKLKAYSENLDDDSDYTLMSNHDFEVLFHATDRDHEIQFRLLYTPLAMQQMVSLLKDTKVGYGDDFRFIKQRKVNLVLPEHLRGFSLTTDPAIYFHYDLAAAREFFISHNAEYFKQIYFSFAPILCVPLYQQTRTAKTIYGYTPGEESCFWEHESLANYLGEERFKHPASITRNILKTEKADRKGNASDIRVTAYGFRGERRLTYVTKWGGDGHYHDVPVEWIEYLPVSKTSQFSLCEQKPLEPSDQERPLVGPKTNLDQYLEKIGLSRAHAFYRRSVFAWMK